MEKRLAHERGGRNGYIVGAAIESKWFTAKFLPDYCFIHIIRKIIDDIEAYRIEPELD